MKTEPYAPTPAIGSFTVVYEGRADDFYCYRVPLRGLPSKRQWAVRSQVQMWISGNLMSRNFCGNGFGTSKLHPTVPYPNEDDADIFVLISSIEDVQAFERQFPVNGFAPGLVA